MRQLMAKTHEVSARGLSATYWAEKAMSVFDSDETRHPLN